MNVIEKTILLLEEQMKDLWIDYDNTDLSEHKEQIKRCIKSRRRIIHQLHFINKSDSNKTEGFPKMMYNEFGGAKDEER